MRNLTAVVIVSAMVVSFSSAWAADVTTIDEMHQDDDGLTNRSMAQNSQSHMFDGINLTEQQRQQMRDLMQQARHERSPISISDLETMHDLVIADKFNETAVKALAEKLAQAQVERQVEMARVRNQMYHLLTPGQQDVLEKRHQQRMKEMRKLTNVQQSSSLQAVSSTGSNQ
ncbi:cell-envelope stress modulator CpxP [Erwiniaceae bacterium BAC15a-03b]|uniref:Cell-envelope stress modulator CpxP n=1 Tax=Winslowiella arboricola TaxID=2978220 RepID=A0A9J6PII9_9GAMM|nr:cell-envelope stress modulator CpxP [Winslowiella arboricola]MCU5773554.1 cell-envelope stress modulator CpxP [Winslowiella arboricola]MCU5776534.1 cell-envelope stress modulator CpxP [Winslowiella arboricola]